jgi:hypothetical protein
MIRANRHYLPGYVWHITHRCHKKEFLLKFDKDKKRWLHWLFESKKTIWAESKTWDRVLISDYNSISIKLNAWGYVV